MKNYEILLIRPNDLNDFASRFDYPYVGRIYAAPDNESVQWAMASYPELAKQTLHTSANLRMRERVSKPSKTTKSTEDDATYAIRCIAALNQIFVDLTKSDVLRAAAVISEEAIVTLMSGCAMPRGEPLEFCLKPGEGWLIKMSAYLWQKGTVFEVIGKITDKSGNLVNNGEVL
ncbi:MAG: hypothetical protein FWF76_02705 [Oscillospiraceae bacterium]|nr:hypothetical protein [Oscillospiraceae bacterium]